MFLGGIAVAHYLAGRYGEAGPLFRRTAAAAAGPSRGAQRMRCANLAQLGRIEEARSLLEKIRAEHPQVSIAWIRANVPYQTPELMDRFIDGMRKAGLQ